MNTNTWRIIPLFHESFWEPEDEALIWDLGDSQYLEIPNCLRTSKDAEALLNLSSLKDAGKPFSNWFAMEI